MLHDVANTLEGQQRGCSARPCRGCDGREQGHEPRAEEMKAKIAASKVDSLFDNAL